MGLARFWETSSLGLGDIFMNSFLALGTFLLATISLATQYPVDEDIKSLRDKANYLETLKKVLESNKCSISIGKNIVTLTPGALRSEGLVMAVGENFPGNYLGYHKAPQPEKLEASVELTFIMAGQGSGKGKGAKIVTARLQLDEKQEKPTHLLVILNDIYQEPSSPELWLYAKGAVKLPISLDSIVKSNGQAKTEYTNTAFSAECN